MSDLEQYISERKAVDPEFLEVFDSGYDEFKIGLMLKELRQKQGISQDELALRTNTKKSVISRMENHSTDIRVSTLQKIAGALGKKVSIVLV